MHEIHCDKNVFSFLIFHFFFTESFGVRIPCTAFNTWCTQLLRSFILLFEIPYFVLLFCFFFMFFSLSTIKQSEFEIWQRVPVFFWLYNFAQMCWFLQFIQSKGKRNHLSLQINKILFTFDRLYFCLSSFFIYLFSFSAAT